MLKRTGTCKGHNFIHHSFFIFAFACAKNLYTHNYAGHNFIHHNCVCSNCAGMCSDTCTFRSRVQADTPTPGAHTHTRARTLLHADTARKHAPGHTRGRMRACARRCAGGPVLVHDRPARLSFSHFARRSEPCPDHTEPRAHQDGRKQLETKKKNGRTKPGGRARCTDVRQPCARCVPWCRCMDLSSRLIERVPTLSGVGTTIFLTTEMSLTF